MGKELFLSRRLSANDNAWTQACFSFLRYLGLVTAVVELFLVVLLIYLLLARILDLSSPASDRATTAGR